MVAPGEVFHEAHDEAVFLRGFEDDGGNVGLAEGDERFKASLAAHEVVPRVIAPGAHGDRLLQAQMRDAGHQFVEDPSCSAREDSGS